MEKFKSKYLVFSAPSGAGKTTIIKELLKKHPRLVLSISATTRAKRNGEVEGKDYFFLSKEAFEAARMENHFLEFEQVHDNYYGTLKEKVDQITDTGRTVVFDIDVMGAESIKKSYPEACLIFIKPPGRQILEQRLKNRKSEDYNTIKRRLERLDFEYEQAEYFDHIVVNDDLATAIEEIESLILYG